MNKLPRQSHLRTIFAALALLAFTAAQAADTYLVVDLSGGTNAVSYPVSYLSDVPAGGWTDEYKTTKLVLRKIMAGTFIMGSPAEELGRYSGETQHVVTLTKDFHIGVFEVTQRQWELVMGNRPSWFTNAAYYATRPVEQVSYYDIRENPANSAISPNWPATNAVHAGSFMGKLRAKTGLAAFDLPTESQWEYACRSGTTTALNSGSNLTATESCPNMAEVGRYWYNGGSGYTQNGSTNVGSAKAGSYLPNVWGLYDMHGNVYEWCLDWYGTYPDTVSDPAGAAAGSHRVWRGGGWNNNALSCRSALRYIGDPSVRFYCYGFRVAGNLSSFDTDADGLPDAWEIEHFGNLITSDGTGDFDHDGRTDAQEFADNTDPANAGSTLGLVAYYPFDGNANDASGNGHHGITNGVLLQDDRLGEAQRAYFFPGNNNGIRIPKLTGWDVVNGEFTIQMWMKANSTTKEYMRLISSYGGGSLKTASFVFFTDIEDHLIRGNFGNGSNDWSPYLLDCSSSLVEAQRWISASFVFRDTTILLYVDDNLVGQCLRPQLVADSDLEIGYWTWDINNAPGINRSYTGSLDDIRIYNRALSSNEVARLYAETAAQPTTHLVTLHPGAHGSIAGANNGSNYVVTVTNNAAFPAVTVNAASGWIFTGWDPPAPATVTNDFEATAGYRLSLGDNLIVNGDFESGNVGFQSDYIFASIYVGERRYDIVHNPTESFPGTSSFTDHTSGSGHMLVANGTVTANTVLWRQSVDVAPQTAYEFSVWGSSWGGSGSDPNPSRARVRINGSVLDSSFQLSGAHGVWQSYSNIWTSGTSTTALIEFYLETISGNGNDPAYDDFRLVGLQPVTHTVTFHPGVHGSISNANSGADYVVTVSNGAAFPAVTVNAVSGWTFTGWNPSAPATVTNDFEATAQYAVDITDTDTDGLPDAWEIARFGNLTASDGTGDFDRDGRTDAQELADNTDPANAGSTLGLVAYYPFDGNANDASGKGNDGTPMHGADFDSGVIGQALELHGGVVAEGATVGDHVIVSHDASLAISNAVTLAGWVRFDHVHSLGWGAEHQALIMKGASQYNYGLMYDPGGPNLNFYHHGLSGTTTSAHWPDRASNTWYHVSATFDGDTDTVKVYINGQIRATSSIASGTLAVNTESLAIGRAMGSHFQYWLYGNLDDVRIYNRALSSNEVARIYTAEPPPTTHLVTLHPGAHGSIAGANAGSNYVVTVTNGAAFPAVTVNAAAGWIFTGNWTPSAPNTVTNDFEATALYEEKAPTFDLNFDITEEFSILGGNPNGVWSYGWMPSDFDHFTLFDHTFVSSENNGFDAWARSDLSLPLLPEVARNALSWTKYGVAPGQVMLHPGPNGEAAVLRFNAPKSASYRFSGAFLPGDWRVMQVGIRRDKEWIFQASDSGAFDKTIKLAKGDTVDFVVYGGFADGSTPIQLVVTGIDTPQPPALTPDLSLSSADLRILNASGAETWNPAVGETVNIEVTVRNTGETNTSGNVLVQVFLDGSPTNLTSYSTNAYTVATSTVVAESLGVGGSRTLLLPWVVTGPDRVVTLTAVAEFATNRAQSQANAAGASGALPVTEASFANNSVGRSLQLGSPAAGTFGIEIRTAAPAGMVSGVRYTLSGTALYNWVTNAPVLGALATVSLNGETYTSRTASPDGAWSVQLNGLPASNFVAHVEVTDGRLTGSTNLTLNVAAGALTVSLRVKQLAFAGGVYRTEGETAYAVTGSNVVLKALVRNDGNAGTNGLQVAFKDPSGAAYVTQSADVPAYGEVWVTASAGWTAQAGASSLSVALAGNSRSCTVVGTAALPDLVVTGLSFAPGSPKAGDTVTVTATVKNQGAAAVLPVLMGVAFSHGGTITTNVTAGLAPGASIAVSTVWTAVAGTYAVRAEADSGGEVTETLEDNNAITQTLSVRQALPDLRPWYLRWGWQQVSGLSFSPAQPVAGESVTVTCDIYNSGTTPLGANKAFDVVFSAGGSVFATNRVMLAAPLAVGASVRAEAVWPGGVAGSTNFTATVDVLGEIAEESEANNGTSAGLTVYPSGASLQAAGLSFSPLQPLPGTAVILTAIVRNDGGAAGGAGAAVAFYAGSTNVSNRIGLTNLTTNVAPKGGTQTASVNWITPSTATNVTIFAVVNGTVYQQALTVTANPAPNLQVFSEDISVTPPLPQNGESVTVSARVRNTAGSVATGFQVHFYKDSPGGWVAIGAPVAVASLAVGSNRIVTANAAILADRSAYSVKVEILPNNAQGDADAGDNIATSSFLLAGTPKADAGTDAACIVGQTVTFDGTASSNATTYAWTLIERPVGSTNELAGANTAHPTLTPDQPGIYRAQLVVGDGLIQSAPDTVTVTARWLALTVASACGAPTPALGSHTFAWGTSVDCRMSSVVNAGLTRYLCTGWTGTGSVPFSGGTTNTSFSITNDSSIVWQWTTNHWLAAGTAGGQGWLSVTGAWFSAGSTATVAAVAADGFRFERWLVDGGTPDGAMTNILTSGGTNTLTVSTGVPHTLTAVFAVLGLPEALDNTGLAWTTGGASNWVGQTHVTFDCVDAAGSGMVSNNAQSWLETSVTNGGTLTFVWRVSSKEQSDQLRFIVDGKVCGLISGETAWRTNTITVPYGNHTFRWVYAKGKSGAAGIDQGWVDQVVWQPLPPLTLAIAVDATNLIWQTEGNTAWFPQTVTTADGIAAAQSGPIGNLGLSCLKTRVRGSGVMAFDWRVSCEEEYDWLVLIVDGVIQRAITGESGWQRVQLALGEGDHELRWEYWKDEGVSEGLDAGWLDRVSWSGAVPPQAGFTLWLADNGLSGDAAGLFGQDRNADGVPNGFEYAFGTNAPPAGPLLNIRMVNGRPVVETPAQDTAAAPYVDLHVLGSTNLTDWTLPVQPAANTTGKPVNRTWHEPQGAPPGRAFFKLKAELK